MMEPETKAVLEASHEFYLTGSGFEHPGVCRSAYTKPADVYHVSARLYSNGELQIRVTTLQGEPARHALMSEATDLTLRFLHESHKDKPVCRLSLTVAA